jgi:hypothetical protein
MTALYVPGTTEQDMSKVIMSQQLVASHTSTNTDNIATNTANIATNTSAITALQSAGYVVGPGSATNNGFAVYDGTTGKLIKDHAATIALASEVSGTLPVANGGTNYTGGAWTTYTPTVTALSGTYTTVSASGSYLVIGKLVHFTCTITQTAIGTASGSIALPLPTGTTAREASCIGMVHNLGKSVGYRLTNASTSGNIAFYDNTSCIANGNTVVVTGIYEQT